MGYWDPPEYDVPTCCKDDMDILPDGSAKCDHCGRVLTTEDVAGPDYPEPPAEVDFEAGGCRECGAPTECVYCSEECAAANPCVHGNVPGDCDACDHLGDLAFDAAREGRGR